MSTTIKKYTKTKEAAEKVLKYLEKTYGQPDAYDAAFWLHELPPNKENEETIYEIGVKYDSLN